MLIRWWAGSSQSTAGLVTAVRSSTLLLLSKVVGDIANDSASDFDRNAPSVSSSAELKAAPSHRGNPDRSSRGDVRTAATNPAVD